jgi:serine/threonine protein kinase/tetratricopeptide (TPR) repeat protein
MTAERWQRVADLYQAALERAGPERAALLEEACAGDEALRGEVASLLAFHEQMGDFLEEPLAHQAAYLLADPRSGPPSLLALQDEAGNLLADVPKDGPHVGQRQMDRPATTGWAGAGEAPALKICRRCNARFAEDQIVCPNDGEVLTEDQAPLVGRILDGLYTIERLLGRGGMGAVYLARHIVLQDLVAIKVLPREVNANPDWLRRFVREGRAARAIRHPNAVTVHDLRTSGDGITYMVQEYIEGHTLRAELEQRERLAPAEALALLEPVASVLDEAHARGVVHRDLKPENIMLGEVDGKRIVKLLDLGIAKLREIVSATESAPTALTLPGQVIGTPHYMSPEQWGELPRDGSSEIDGRADVYSLGVLVYELVSGSRPFRGATFQELRHAHVHATPASIHELVGQLPKAFALSVARALSKDRAHRQSTAGAFTRELRESLTGISADTLIISSDEKSGAMTTPAPGAVPLQRKRPSRKAIDSLAVLPLVNVSVDPNMDYFSDGITESIINALSPLPKLRVVPRNTVFTYKGQEADPQKVGSALDVRAVLTGRLRHLGDRLVISVELVDVVNNSQLWGEQYNRKVSDIFEIQEEIAREISHHLRMKLTSGERKHLAKRHTEKTEAYQHYLKGRYFWNKRTEADLNKAIEHFLRAINEDPAYALAYTGMADAYSYLGYMWGRMPPKEAMPKAKDAAVKALELDNDLSEAHCSLAFMKLFYEWDWPGAEEEFRRAIELNPNYPSAHHFYGIYLAAVWERFEEAIAEVKRALELDPLSLPINNIVAVILLDARRYDEAIDQRLKMLEIDPNYTAAYDGLGFAYGQKGMHEEAVEAYLEAKRLGGASAETAEALRQAYVTAGWEGYLRRNLDLLLTRWEQGGHWHGDAYAIAGNYARVGEKEKAFAWLETAYEARSGFLTWLKIQASFDGLRSDARFAGLIQRVGLPQ